MYRTRLPIHRDCERFIDYHINGPVYDSKAGFADWVQKRSVIKHLVRVCGGLFCINATGYHNHRDALLICVGNDVSQIRDSGSNSGHQHRWRTSCMMRAFSHEPAAVFMLAQHKLHPDTIESIDHGQDFTTRNSKSMTASCVKQPLCDNICTSGHLVIPSLGPGLRNPSVFAEVFDQEGG